MDIKQNETILGVAHMLPVICPIPHPFNKVKWFICNYTGKSTTFKPKPNNINYELQQFPASIMKQQHDWDFQGRNGEPKMALFFSVME